MSESAVNPLKRKFHQADSLKRNEQMRGIAARLECDGEGGAGLHQLVGDRYQALRAVTELYRSHHLGPEAVYRYFELAAKSRFKPPTEMPTLPEEAEERWKEREWDRGDGNKWRIPKFKEPADALISASLHTSPIAHFQILLELLRYQAQELVGSEEHEEQARNEAEKHALQTLRCDFLYGHCGGLTHRPEGSPMNALEKLQLGIFWTLCISKSQDGASSITRFDFGPIADAVKPAAQDLLPGTKDQAAAQKLKGLIDAPALEHCDVLSILRAVDDLHNRPVGSTYADMSRRRPLLERLVRFKTLTMREQEAAEHHRNEQSGRHRSTTQSDSLLRKTWESHKHSDPQRPGTAWFKLGLADLLVGATSESTRGGIDHFGLLLKHGTMYVANEALREQELCARRDSHCDRGRGEIGRGEVIVAPWIEAYTRLLTPPDAAETDAATLIYQIKRLVRSMDGAGLKVGLNTSQWEQIAICKVLQRALKLLSLHPVFRWGKTIPGTKSKKYLESMTIREDGISAAMSRCCSVHLSDLYHIYCPVAKEHVRADQYRRIVKQHAHIEQRCSDPWLSRESSPSRDRASTSSPDPHSSQTVFFSDVLLINPDDRYERYDQVRTKALHERLKSDEGERHKALQIVERSLCDARDTERLSPSDAVVGNRIRTLESDRRKLLRANDMQSVTQALIALPDANRGDGLIRQQVSYHHPYRLGRRFAKSCDTVSASMPDNDPAETALCRTQPGKSSRSMKRPACYQGMLKDLRAVCGGAFLHDVDMVKCFPSIIHNMARYHGLLQRMPTLVAFMECPNAFLASVAHDHNLNTDKVEAKALINSLICGASYKKWLKERQLTREMEAVRTFNKEVREFQKVVLNIWECKDEVQDRLLKERLRDGMSDPIKDQVRGGIERSMFALWLQGRENELLMLIVRMLEEEGWKVMALIFDGVLVEHKEGSDSSLDDALRNVEKRLKENLPYKWDVALAEKALYGLQDEPVHTVEEATVVLRNVLSPRA